MKPMFKGALGALIVVLALSGLTAASASAAPWSIRETPAFPKMEAQSSLLGVSCTSSASCTATGYTTSSSRVRVPLAERWNGTEWSIQEPPFVSGARNGELKAVSCSSSEACIAVGSYTNSAGVVVTLAERWNGKEWSLQTTKNPEGAKASVLSGVSCTSSEACTAVGSYTNSAGVVVTLAERWNGKEWSLQTTKNPEGASASALSSVSCASSEVCSAVGSYTNSAGTVVTLGEHWNGKEWVIGLAQTKNPTGATASSLSSISCASTKSCAGVGNYTNSAGTVVTLAESEGELTWTLHESPNPTGAKSSVLSGVSCSSSEACSATGKSVNSANVTVILAERWNGKEWSIQETKTPTGAKESSLRSVSCSTSEACTGVGSYVNSSGVEVPLAEQWNGKEWKIQTAATPKVPAEGKLTNISCTSASACIAVGTYRNSASIWVTMAGRWNGTAWSTQETPNPAKATSTVLKDVSCSSASSCVAVGSRTDGATIWTVAERWNGTSWTLYEPPNPAETTENVLSGVSCTSAEACTAVGYARWATGTFRTLAERWNGTSWTIQETPDPKESEKYQLTDVSCTSAEACTAGGRYFNSAGTEMTLAERWNGKEWTIQPTPNPAGAKQTLLLGLSCWSSEGCVSVGGSVNSAGVLLTLAERWNGKEWTIQETPNPENGTDLSEVSCTSGEACTAVGSSSGKRLLVEQWNGTAWTLQEASGPKENQSSELAGVSCVAGGYCVAAGRYVNNAGVEAMLVEEN